MAVFPRPSSPRVLLADLRTFLATRQRHQLLFGFISLLIPALLVTGFYVDSRIDPPKPEMYFIPSWPATRTDAEIVALQKIDQAKKDKMLAERRAAYQRLAKQLGMDD